MYYNSFRRYKRNIFHKYNPCTIVKKNLLNDSESLYFLSMPQIKRFQPVSLQLHFIYVHPFMYVHTYQLHIFMITKLLRQVNLVPSRFFKSVSKTKINRRKSFPCLNNHQGGQCSFFFLKKWRLYLVSSGVVNE